MDRNTMIVRLVEALLWFAALIVVVLRLDRLLVRLRELQLHVGEAFKVSARFFRPKRGTRHLMYDMGGLAHVVVGDEFTIDHLIVTHPDDDHQILVAPHHGRRSVSRA